MADNYNFINCGRRTELVKNPDQYGNGITIGYYRQGFSDYRAVKYIPFRDEKDFKTELEAQSWLKQEIDRDY